MASPKHKIRILKGSEIKHHEECLKSSKILKDSARIPSIVTRHEIKRKKGALRLANRDKNRIWTFYEDRRFESFVLPTWN